MPSQTGSALFIPEKTALIELEPPPPLGGRAKYGYIVAAWLAWVREVARLLRRINATGIQHGIVTTDDDGTATVIEGRLENTPYDVLAFTADVGTWDVEALDVVTWHRLLLGRQLFLAWDFRTTTVTGTPAELRAALPGGNIAALNITALCVIDDNGAPTVGVATATPLSPLLVFTRLDGGAFSDSTDGTRVRGSMILETE
tara:strand:- start:320 stop:922 length:603 start_codon:yes stop_codon:yes gene_type:complete